MPLEVSLIFLIFLMMLLSQTPKKGIILFLSNNSIEIPSTRKNPSSGHGFLLETLDLSFNKISSEADLRLLVSNPGLLRQLDLTRNQLSGRIPLINNYFSLQHLDLSMNEFTGDIMAGVFDGCWSLSYLNLSANHFIGTLPTDLSSCSVLTSLSLSNNFSGEFPFKTLSSSLPNLEILDLSFNIFSGPLLNSVLKLPMLELLNLNSNGFLGSIPLTLCQSYETSLEELYLQNNQFTGHVLESLSNCFKLVLLDLSRVYIGSTRTKPYDLNPFWNEVLFFDAVDPLDLPICTIHVAIYHDGSTSCGH